MANVLNRTTGVSYPYRKDYRTSVNTEDFPVANWIINPDLSLVAGQPDKYWIITGDTVTLADAGTQASIDADIVTQDTIAKRNDAVLRPDAAGPDGVSLRVLFEVFNKRDNYLVNRIAELQAALDAVKATSGPADNIRAAIPASWLPTNTRTRAAAIQDYKDNINAGGAD